jgi:multidrug efflux pump subunit AcrA (membrane-fusion protein)
VDGAAGPDPQLVTEMKHEIHSLVQEIAQLAARDIPLDEFYAGFLPRVVSAMAAVGGAVWTPGERGGLKLQHQVNLSQTGLDQTPHARKRHELLLSKVLNSNQAVLVPPESGQGEGQAGNPTSLLLVIAPLIADQQPQAVVEIFQRAGAGPTTQRGYLRFLIQMCEVACDYLKSRRLRQLTDREALWRQLEELVDQLHRSLDVRDTAYAIVNEGRRIIGCDRVSLALANRTSGAGCRIEAVSGLDTIDRRAGQVRSLAQLAKAVLRTGEPLWSDGSEDLPPQLQQPLQQYMDQAHGRLVAVLPLARPSGGRAVGALVVEQLRSASADELLQQRARLVAHHSGLALANSIEHSSVFLLPVWKALGRATWMLRGAALPKTLILLLLLIGGIFGLATVPTDFEVAARGKLQPAVRREIFAPLDGVMARVPVQHGQMVEKGEVLAELTCTDLELQLAALIGRQTTNQERLASLQRALLDTPTGSARHSTMDENRLAGEMLQLRQEADNIERELALLREKQAQLRVTAPQRGQVVTWKVRDLLLMRPVSRGQGLMTLADPEGPWELELYLPERRLKHVQSGGWGCPDGNPGAPPLRVTFILSSHPGQTFEGQVVEIEQTAEVRGDEGNTVLVRVAVDKDQLPPLHDQTTVTARLHCGRTSIGFAWFCDLIETVQTKILFWLPS